MIPAFSCGYAGIQVRAAYHSGSGSAGGDALVVAGRWLFALEKFRGRRYYAARACSLVFIVDSFLLAKQLESQHLAEVAIVRMVLDSGEMLDNLRFAA